VLFISMGVMSSSIPKSKDRFMERPPMKTVQP
jgi:hypothetical protein